jgi:hypothetical protein
MARALFGVLAVAMLGLTGFYAYSWYNTDQPGCDATTIAAPAVKKSCCAAEKPASCCTETTDAAACTGECPTKAAKNTCDEGACADKKEGECCQDKKEKTEPKKD